MKGKCILICLCFYQGLVAGDLSEDAELKELATWMRGLYSNEAQATADQKFFDLRLAIYPFWENHTDGYWFYVEQATAQRLNRPYRQEIYQLCRNENGDIQLVIYAIKEERNFIGAHRRRNTPLSNLTMNMLIKRNGCALVLKKKGDSYKGQTDGKACENRLRNATYMTWALSVSENEISSWDKGYSASDQQVWGNEIGPFQFKQVPIEEADSAK